MSLITPLQQHFPKVFRQFSSLGYASHTLSNVETLLLGPNYHQCAFDQVDIYSNNVLIVTFPTGASYGVTLPGNSTLPPEFFKTIRSSLVDDTLPECTPDLSQIGFSVAWQIRVDDSDLEGNLNLGITESSQKHERDTSTAVLVFEGSRYGGSRYCFVMGPISYNDAKCYLRRQR